MSLNPIQSQLHYDLLTLSFSRVEVGNCCHVFLVSQSKETNNCFFFNELAFLRTGREYISLLTSSILYSRSSVAGVVCLLFYSATWSSFCFFDKGLSSIFNSETLSLGLLRTGRESINLLISSILYSRSSVARGGMACTTAVETINRIKGNFISIK